MEYVKLGRTGLEVSRICLGCMSYGDPAWRPWILDEETAGAHFRDAVEAGINFFDTADMYSRGRSEEVTGRWLRELTRRDEVVVATKLFFPLREGPWPWIPDLGVAWALGLDGVGLVPTGRGNFHGPGNITTVNMALYKTIPVGGSARLRLGAQVINLTNSPSFALGSGSGAYGSNEPFHQIGDDANPYVARVFGASPSFEDDVPVPGIPPGAAPGFHAVTVAVWDPLLDAQAAGSRQGGGR